MMVDGLAIIPARMGSKGVPGKNWKRLGSKPLLQYSIDVFRESKLNFDLLISTDDPKIEKIASENNIKLHERSDKTATDEASMFEVVKEVLEGFIDPPTIFLLLQPTSPFRTSENIINALKLFDDDTNGVIAMKKIDENPYFMFSISTDGTAVSLADPNTYRRRQDAPQFYYPTGSIYLLRTEIFLKEKSFYPSKSKILEVTQNEGFDIDTSLDWNLAEKMMKSNFI